MSEEPSQVESGIHPKLINPLSEVTRKERVYLLGMSAVSITIVFTGLIPTEINTLGIKFAQADRNSLLFIFAFVVGYFLFAFSSYALSDYLEWLTVRRSLALGKQRKDLNRQRSNIQQRLETIQKQQDRLTSERQRIAIQKQQGDPPTSVPDDEYEFERLEHERERLEHERERLEHERHLERQFDETKKDMGLELATLHEYEEEIAAQSDAPFALTGPVIVLRFIFEFILPPFVGVLAVVALVTRAL